MATLFQPARGARSGWSTERVSTSAEVDLRNFLKKFLKKPQKLSDFLIEMKKSARVGGFLPLTSN
jgi:hypothetical protein